MEVGDFDLVALALADWDLPPLCRVWSVMMTFRARPVLPFTRIKIMPSLFNASSWRDAIPIATERPPARLLMNWVSLSPACSSWPCDGRDPLYYSMRSRFSASRSAAWPLTSTKNPASTCCFILRCVTWYMFPLLPLHFLLSFALPLALPLPLLPLARPPPHQFLHSHRLLPRPPCRTSCLVSFVLASLAKERFSRVCCRVVFAGPFGLDFELVDIVTVQRRAAPPRLLCVLCRYELVDKSFQSLVGSTTCGGLWTGNASPRP